MFFHHFKFFIRKVRKDGFTYLLSHVGLVVGLSAFILIGIYIHQEFNYGAYVKGHDSIYRIHTQYKRGNPNIFALSYGYLKQKLEADFPEITNATRIMHSQGQSVFRIEGKTFNIREGTAFYVDEDFLKVFELPIVDGDSEQPLNPPNAIVVTESFAERLFGNERAVGKTIEVVEDENSQSLVVTAVLKDFPATSHFQFDYIQSGHTLGYWDHLGTLKSGIGNYVYYKTEHPINTEVFDQTFIDNLPEIPRAATLTSMPLADIHFESKALFEHSKTANMEQLVLIELAALLLFVASFINYLIIHIAQLIGRSGEFGIKKAMGVSSSQWTSQCIIESMLSILVVALVAMLGSYYINQFFLADTLGTNLFAIITLPQFLFFGLLILMISLITITISVVKLKSQFGLSSKTNALEGVSTRSGLKNRISLLVQFSFALLTICGSYFVWQQLNHLQSIDLGYTGDWRINITRSTDTSHGEWSRFKASIKGVPGIENEGSSLYEWAGSMYNTGRIKVVADNTLDTVGVRVKYNYISDGLIPTLDLELVSGRNFNRGLAQDTFNIIINETAAKAFGVQEIIGKRFQSQVFDEKSGKIIGVVKDFHVETMDKEVAPMVLFFLHEDLWKENLIVQLNVKNMRQSLDNIQAAWNQSGIISPFEYTFLDQFQTRLFKRETQSAQFMGVTASCSILVALIGLIGLVSFQNKRRSKELSLRKVFGASVPDLLMMINRTYAMLIGISVLLSLPLAYWAVSQWLDGYAYRISPTIWDFALVAAGVLLVSLVTVSLQSWKTATSNPTDVLKSE